MIVEIAIVSGLTLMWIVIVKLSIRHQNKIESCDFEEEEELLVDKEMESKSASYCSTSLSERKEPFPLFGTSDTRRDMQRTIGLLLVGVVILITIGSIFDYLWLGTTSCTISFLALIVCGLLLIVPLVEKNTQVTSKKAFTNLVVFIVIIVLIVGTLSWWVGGTTESRIYKSASDAVNNLEWDFTDIDPFYPAVTMGHEDVKYNSEHLSVEITIHFSKPVTYIEKEAFAVTAASAAFEDISETELTHVTIWTSDFTTPKIFSYDRDDFR